jgi:hypothetical protein
MHHTPVEMDSKPKTEFDKFKETMKRLVAVPLSEVKELEKKRRPKRRSASRAANAKS